MNPPTVPYNPGRCQAQFGIWIKPDGLVIAPRGWMWNHPEPGCYMIYPQKFDTGEDLSRTLVTAGFYVESAAAAPAASVEYTYNANIVLPPSSGQLRMDNAVQASATLLRLSYTTPGGVDVKVGILQIQSGNRIWIQDKDDSTRYQVYDASGAAVDLTTYAEVPVVWSKGGADLPAQRVMLVIGGPVPAVAGTLITEVRSDAYVIWTFDAARVLTDIGVSISVTAPMQ